MFYFGDVQNRCLWLGWLGSGCVDLIYVYILLIQDINQVSPLRHTVYLASVQCNDIHIR